MWPEADSLSGYYYKQISNFLLYFVSIYLRVHKLPLLLKIILYNPSINLIVNTVHQFV